LNNVKKLDYSTTHQEIVERCKRGDRDAQFELYRLYAKAMYNTCLRMVKNEFDAEDILQNSFIDVFTKLHTFKFQSSIGAWIKRIVINNCINFLKRQKNKFDEIDDRIVVEEDPVHPEPDKLEVEAVREAITKLPDGYRIVFSLYCLEGYDHEEISEILDISISTSKSQYSRAKKKLKELLKTL